MLRNIFAALFAAILLSACASSSGKGTFRGTDTRNVESAMMSPANDIGLDDIEIPDYLTAMTNPYADTPESCELISTELAKLNVILGDDVDVPEEIAKRREQNALNATSSTIGSVLIPFRGVVRVISGAASNERDARQAYERGLVRRAYLKGISKQMACQGS